MFLCPNLERKKLRKSCKIHTRWPVPASALQSCVGSASLRKLNPCDQRNRRKLVARVCNHKPIIPLHLASLQVHSRKLDNGQFGTKLRQ